MSSAYAMSRRNDPMAERLNDILRPPEWMSQGLCRQVDADLFFPEKGGGTKDAKAVCFRCPFRQECLDYALDREEPYGVWGGVSEYGRRKMLAKPKVAPPEIKTTDPTKPKWRGHPESVIRAWLDRYEAGESYARIGSTYGLSESVIRKAIGEWRKGIEAASPTVIRPNRALNPRQSQILNLKSQGMRNCDIARTLNLTPKAVKDTVKSLRHRGFLATEAAA